MGNIAAVSSEVLVELRPAGRVVEALAREGGGDKPDSE